MRRNQGRKFRDLSSTVKDKEAIFGLLVVILSILKTCYGIFFNTNPGYFEILVFLVR